MEEEGVGSYFRDLLPSISQGGKPEEYVDRGNVLRVRLRYEDAKVLAWRDARGKILLNPPLRKTTRVFDSPFREEQNQDRRNLADLSAVEAWRELGLIDDQALPTKRGEIFSFFQEARVWPLRLPWRMPTIRSRNLSMTWPTCGPGIVFAPWPSPSPESVWFVVKRSDSRIVPVT